jgi:hypothetical protein
MQSIRCQSRLSISHAPSSFFDTFLVSQTCQHTIVSQFMPIVTPTAKMPATNAALTQQQSAVHPAKGVFPQGRNNQSHSNIIHLDKNIQPQKTRCGSSDRSSLRSIFGRGLQVLISSRKEFRATVGPLDNCVASIRNDMDATINVRLSLNEVQDLLMSKHGMAATASALYKEWDTTTRTVHDEAKRDTTSLVPSDRTLSSLNVYRSIMEIRSLSETTWERAQYRPWDTVPVMTICDARSRI